MNKLIFRLKGGLGNQMFQYAFARSLNLKYPTSKLYLEYSLLNQERSRKLGLIHYKISKELFVCDNNIFRFNNPIYNWILFKFSSTPYYFERKVSDFDSHISSIRHGIFDGYWQSPRYFDKYKAILSEEFTPLKLDRDISKQCDKIENCNSVAVHIRRTDYLQKSNKSIYANCSKKYYSNCIKFICKVLEKPEFFVFSDDYNWVKKNQIFDGLNYNFVSNKDFEDIFLMSKCKHFIIANSTFSWWGAYLGEKPNSIILAPTNWFNPKFKSQFQIYPKNWIKIIN